VTPDWQNFSQVPGRPPYVERFAARMPDGRFLDLPLRETGDIAVADFIAEQASFLVIDALAEWLARAVRPLRPDVVVGLSGRGSILAAEVARRLSHANWVPATDRPRAWFTEALSVPAPSDAGAAPGGGAARWWLDPASVPRLRGRRVLLVHDVLGPACGLEAAASLPARAGAQSTIVAVAVVQGDRWVADRLADFPVVAVFATPSFQLSVGGWVPNEGSAVWRVCPLFRHGAMRPGEAGAAPSVARGAGGTV
jgi:adenine/guanine phosphoribosyltransferase-like PRPP-binding protein